MATKGPSKLVGGPAWHKKALVFLLSASEHGSSVVTYTVGALTEWPTRTFTVHKNLLCRASKYFDTALNGQFMERSKKKLELPHDSPEAFEVLYHWVYTGFFYSKPIPANGPEADHDLYWLEIYNFAECRLIPHLQEWAFEQFHNIHNGRDDFAPSTAFIERLFGLDPIGGLSLLQDYVIGHVAFWLSSHAKSCGDDDDEFSEACEGRFAQQVVRRLSEWRSISHDGRRCHPYKEPAFKEARAEALRLGYASAQTPEGISLGSDSRASFD